ncbi:MAG TPA: hypothetical protein VEY33_04675 [Gemmatimonadota bacterium]|nr:hypothetical protein [Gemmatimonadota bacterium]
MMSRAAWRIGGASGTVAAVTVLGLFLTSAGNATGQLLALELLGRDADRVSRAETAGPDGYTDVHFRVKVKFSQPTTIRSITLQRPGDGDRPGGDLVYRTRDSSGELLLVESDGERVNGGFTDRLLTIDREDLYLGDNGTLDVGSRVLVEITLASGAFVRRAFTLAPPKNRLLGIWQVHCDPGSPDAFKPMTLSGRLWIDLGEDGSATRGINGIPLAGTLEGDSIDVAGESALGRASVRGELARPSNKGGRPSASGWLEYLPVEARCGGGPWWTE